MRVRVFDPSINTWFFSPLYACLPPHRRPLKPYACFALFSSFPTGMHCFHHPAAQPGEGKRSAPSQDIP